MWNRKRSTRRTTNTHQTCRNTIQTTKQVHLFHTKVKRIEKMDIQVRVKDIINSYELMEENTQ